MSIEIITEARYIPSGTRVCKPTGEKEYTLWVRGVPVYDVPGCDKKIFMLEEFFVIQSLTSMNVISPHTKLKILCGDISYARHILDGIENTVEERREKLKTVIVR